MNLNLVEQIINYENGNMDEKEMVTFFQGLIDTGLAWSFQGHYGRTAAALIEEGYCTYTQGEENENVEKI